MGRIKIEYPDGATPLDPNEIDGLIPRHLTTQNDLNEYEQQNIIEAITWVNSHKFNLNQILKIDFLLKLHKRMFDKTWRWAGKFRKSNKNIGVEKSIIHQELYKLFQDINFQLSCKTYPLDEIAVRFHHRLVSIHPFANGNGRHSRIITDILLDIIKQPPFTWGEAELRSKSEAREKYIAALKKADKYDYQDLMEFVRS